MSKTDDFPQFLLELPEPKQATTRGGNASPNIVSLKEIRETETIEKIEQRVRRAGVFAI